MTSLNWFCGFVGFPTRQCKQPKNQQLCKIKSNQRSRLVNLNDDCLISILELLTLEDLKSIAVTCNRLYTIARIVFHQNKDFNCLYVYDIIDSHRTSAIPFIKRHLKLFGSRIKTVTMDFNAQNELALNSRSIQSKILKAIVTYCSGTLEELQLCGVDLHAKQIRSAELLFRNLKCLKLNLYDDVCTSMILAISTNCTELDINGELDEFDFSNNYPNLQRFSLTHRGNHMELRIRLVALELFLARHQQLKYVKMMADGDFDFTVFQLMANLQELEFYGNRVNGGQPMVLSHQPSTNLKRLVLYCRYRSAATVLNALPIANSLEYLEVNECYINSEFMQCLGKLLKLRSLKISFMVFPKYSSLNRLHGLNELEEISLTGPRTINDNCLINIVRRVKGLQRLTFIDMGQEGLINSEVYQELVAECRRKGKKLSVDYYRNRHCDGNVNDFNANANDCDFVEICLKTFKDIFY